MAIVNGTNYDHIDLQSVAGGDTVRHMYQDTAGRAMLAPTEASSTASMAHVPGTDSEFFVYNNKLYQATVSIAQGGTITPNTNCKEAPLGKAVSDLKSAIDEICKALLASGKYYEAMAAWFKANGCAAMADLTGLCDRWYRISRLGWEGGTRFLNTDQGSVSTGTKVGDNAGLVCEPSTNETAGRDDYANLPLFSVADCNWTVDSNGKRHIIAIDGITSYNAFERDNPDKLVGVIQMAPWIKQTQEVGTYTYWMTDKENADGYVPVSEAVDLDGTLHPWVIHGKYAFNDGGWGCYSGANTRRYDVSHNSQRTGVRGKWGNQYCGKASCDDAWMKLHVFIKYASLTLDGIMNGCCSYYWANGKAPIVAETGVKRVILGESDANYVVVGSAVAISTSSSVAYSSAKSSIGSLVYGAVVTSKEAVTVNGVSGVALNLDVAEAFDVETTYTVNVIAWRTGSTDHVKGNDGSPVSNTSSKEPYKLQGIEQSYGFYEVIADAILNYEASGGSTLLCVYVCRDASKINTEIDANYHKVGYSALADGGSDGWNYIKRLGFDPNYPEVWFGKELGGSSSTYTKDGLYIKKAGTTGPYEWQALGTLFNGLTGAGLSCAVANSGLPLANWSVGGRLSPNGSRGELAA